MSKSLQTHGLQHIRLPCPSPTPRVCSNSCPSGWWCHPTISSSIVPFSSCLQSVPTWGSFPMSHLFASCGQSVEASASASVLPVNIQDWFPLGLTGWISLQSKGLSGVFSGPISSWQIEGGKVEAVKFYFLGLQNHCRWWLQPWNWKTLAPWKESYDKPRKHIKK